MVAEGWDAVVGHRGLEEQPHTHEDPQEEAAVVAADDAAVVAAAQVGAAEVVPESVGDGHRASFLCQKSCKT